MSKIPFFGGMVPQYFHSTLFWILDIKEVTDAGVVSFGIRIPKEKHDMVPTKN